MKRAFTLIELLVVIASIGILTGMILPAINSARNKVRAAQEKVQEQPKTIEEVRFNMSDPIQSPSGSNPYSYHIVTDVYTGRQYLLLTRYDELAITELLEGLEVE